MFSLIRPCGCQVEIEVRPQPCRAASKMFSIVPHWIAVMDTSEEHWLFTRVLGLSDKSQRIWTGCRVKTFCGAAPWQGSHCVPALWGQLQELNSDTLKAFRAKRRRRSGAKRCDSPLITGVYTTMPARLGSDTVLSRMRPPMLRTAT